MPRLLAIHYLGVKFFFECLAAGVKSFIAYTYGDLFNKLLLPENLVWILVVC